MSNSDLSGPDNLATLSLPDTRTGLVDGFGRLHTDLRVSLTDRCSLRCSYCMPEVGMQWLSNDNILSADELERVIAQFVRLGVHTVRLTGGEPLLRPDLADIVRRVAALRTVTGKPVEVAMTTNGIGLAKHLPDLIPCGLSRLNISLDTLHADRFRALAKRDRLAEVIEGIDAASSSGLRPLKLNAVAMRGINEDELCDLVDFALERDAEMRFIEQMPLDISHTWSRDNLLTGSEILEILSERFELKPVGQRGSHPAEDWYINGGPARVGIIASVTSAFCSNCNRLRLTADGQVRNCLFAREESDLRELIRAGATDDELERNIRVAVLGKRAGHGIGDPTFVQPERGMNAIGG